MRQPSQRLAAKSTGHQRAIECIGDYVIKAKSKKWVFRCFQAELENTRTPAVVLTLGTDRVILSLHLSQEDGSDVPIMDFR